MRLVQPDGAHAVNIRRDIFPAATHLCAVYHVIIVVELNPANDYSLFGGCHHERLPHVKAPRQNQVRLGLKVSGSQVGQEVRT